MKHIRGEHLWRLVWHDLGRWIYRCYWCGEIGYGVPR